MMAERLRADARDNRDRILAAVQVVFREQGIDAPMKEIADRAGVGVGTLYRRFPDRESLISAAGHAYLSGLADLAAAARGEEAGAWPTLCRFLRECVDMRLGALAAALEQGLHDYIRNDPNLVAIRATVAEHVFAMTTAAQDTGDLRTDVTPADIARLMTLQIYVLPGEPYSEAARRVIDIALDGLRAH
jgi:AcrR family transcriptional regulator